MLLVIAAIDISLIYTDTMLNLINKSIEVAEIISESMIIFMATELEVLNSSLSAEEIYESV